jgi:environmental stress-induced protein Ves
MTCTLRRAADLVISPWPNGAGRKADIASGPGWLVAFAWLDTDAPFSDYTGIDRTITLIDGAGFELRLDRGETLHVAPLQPTAFDGGEALACHLPDGPCRVVNVMTQRGSWQHVVRIGAAVPTGPGVSVVVALDDGLTLRGHGQSFSLQRWDSVLIEGICDIAGSGRFATLAVSGLCISQPGPVSLPAS